MTIVAWQDNRGNVYEPSLIEEKPVNLLNNDGILISLTVIIVNWMIIDTYILVF